MEKQGINILKDIFILILTIGLIAGLWIAGVKSFRFLLILTMLILIVGNFEIVILALQRIFHLLSKLNFIHVSWFFLLVGILVWRVRTKYAMVTNPLDTPAKLKIFFISMAGLFGLASTFRLIGERKLSPFWLIPDFILIYSVSSLLSTLLSPYTYYSLYKAIELLIVTTVLFATTGYAVFSSETSKKTIDLILSFFAFLLLTECIAAIINPEVGFKSFESSIGHILVGTFPLMDPDGIGFLSAIVSLSCICRIMGAKNWQDKKFYIYVAFFSLVTLFLSQARTSIFGFFTALAIVLILNGRTTWLIVITFLLTLSLIGFHNYVIKYFLRGQNLEMFLKVSGRTEAWRYAWSKFSQAPLLGYGFAATGFTIISMHAVGGMSIFNSFIECLVNSGFIGFLPWITAFIVTWSTLVFAFFRYRKIMKPVVRSLNIELIGLMTILTFRSMTTSMLIILSHEFLLYMAIIVFTQSILSSRNFLVDEI